jgi:MoaA/NifB/PqqE/SkfB family radical SAM enzyme
MRCNLSCRHCHVQAGPERTEAMARPTLEACLEVFAKGGFTVLDITGGAPEMNPEYRWFIDEATQLAQAAGGKVITRTNLVILTEDGYGDLPEFWARRGVEVVCSLPSWVERNTDRQRGEGVFVRAIEGLRLLNAVGYGGGAAPAGGTEGSEDARDTTADNAGGTRGGTAAKTDSVDAPATGGRPLVLNIVVNPGGAFLPPSQESAEREFAQKLAEQHGVVFDHLLTITNNPIGRFGELLAQRGMYDAYLQRLADSFNPATVENMMCRSQLSVAWDGRVFDCDFNQALDWPLEQQPTIFAVAEQGVFPRELRLGDHCYACTAGAGSSCGGATAA